MSVGSAKINDAVETQSANIISIINSTKSSSYKDLFNEKSTRLNAAKFKNKTKMKSFAIACGLISVGYSWINF